MNDIKTGIADLKKHRRKVPFNKVNVAKYLVNIQDCGNIMANVVATKAIEHLGLARAYKKVRNGAKIKA